MQRRKKATIAGALYWYSIAALSVLIPAQLLWGTTYYFVVDVPTELNTTNYTGNQIVKSIDAVYSLEAALPDGVEMRALHRRDNGNWLFSPSDPATINSTDYEPRDVIEYDGSNYSLYFDGSATGVPDYAGIDAIAMNTSGNLVLSFNCPVNISAAEYSQSDLVVYSGSFSTFWDAESAGVPGYANVSGADVPGSTLIVISFDVPTNIGGTDYLPGQLVQYNGSAFSIYYADAGWPLSSQLNDFAIYTVPASGSVPDGNVVSGTPLTVAKATGTDITLAWGASCLISDTDYEIYEGSIGDYASHADKFCTTSGATTITFLPDTGSVYYLVVPRNDTYEGSYGYDSYGVERPQGTTTCLPQQIGSCP